MRFYRCKCGNVTAWGSMPPYQCSQCPKCKSDLAEGPSLHADPIPHEFLTVPVIVDQGEMTVTRCRYCSRTKAEIEKSELGDEQGKERV